MAGMIVIIIVCVVMRFTVIVAVFMRRFMRMPCMTVVCVMRRAILGRLPIAKQGRARRFGGGRKQRLAATALAAVGGGGGSRWGRRITACGFMAMGIGRTLALFWHGIGVHASIGNNEVTLRSSDDANVHIARSGAVAHW